jgi:uncharacterized protein YecE (DUF72 family)
MFIQQSNTTLSDNCRLLVGTSGYSYPEWVAAGFYPPGTQSSGMLAAYARTFSVAELNYTWYRMPAADAVERMRQKVPQGFRFTAKLTRTLTHEIEPDQWRAQAAAYRAGIAPLHQARQLTAVLVQFPPQFRREREQRLYLAALLEELQGLPLAVEFRHASWVSERVFDELARRRITLVAVDMPGLPGLFPPLEVVTNPDLFYVRFHGRNTKGWRSGDMQKQFDYDYSAAELNEWVTEQIETMAHQARLGLIFFNNHVRAQAPRNALQLMDQLVQRGLLSAQADRQSPTLSGP